MGAIYVAGSGILVILSTIALRFGGNQAGVDYDGALHLPEEAAPAGCFPALFAFGGSMTDTGALATALPVQRASLPPYGTTFPGTPFSRFSDGLLGIDFVARALRLPYLDPYLKSLGSNYRGGANFAAAGATAGNLTDLCPIPFGIQVNQFKQFKAGVISIISQSQESGSPRAKYEASKLPKAEYFRDALYIINIGVNDFLVWLIILGKTLEEVKLLVPEISQSIFTDVEALYEEGARNILVEDVLPFGCLPVHLTQFVKQYANQIDDAGCIEPFNELAIYHNSLLRRGVVELNGRLSGANITVVDTFTVRYNAIKNYKEYGFKVPLKTCCGNGGDYNFNHDCLCGQSKVIDGQFLEAVACDNISSHIQWDGAHYTEAFYRLITKEVLTGKHFDPPFELIKNSCTLADI